MLYKIWNSNSFCTNFYIFNKSFKSKPTHDDAKLINYYFHKQLVFPNKKIQTTRFSRLVNAIKQNKTYICSTGKTSRFINIDIDDNTENIYKTLVDYYSKKIELKEMNDKTNKNSLFLKYLLPTLAYETNSSSMSKPKLRLIYALASNCDKELLTKTTEKLIFLINYCFNSIVANASKNLKQLFYGTLNKVFDTKNIRVYNLEKLDEILDYIFWLLGIELPLTAKKHSNISIKITDVIYSNNYDEALWIYIALSKLNLQYLLFTKQKWLDKFHKTIINRPYFKVKRNTKGYEILQKYFIKSQKGV
ncbi:hypothetical protein HLA87_03220 [Mycoplasma miroungigenitalium]|uniref:Uncharacterized protein n=1 Tax=Mycoplasma miroungigenitalium TaxID=754515 RepID=A0A6M4JFF0_9MOLU|nr:hypothetical protein [Mycoplasma miroungigenitalium]QJR43772.1 hypothetical protein HLA87_03220 [Mycoplasma miroungigenitalium]